MLADATRRSGLSLDCPCVRVLARSGARALVHMRICVCLLAGPAALLPGPVRFSLLCQPASASAGEWNKLGRGRALTPFALKRHFGNLLGVKKEKVYGI